MESIKSQKISLPQAVEALAALAQEARLAIFRRLVQAGPAGLPAGEIAQALEIPPSTLSFHLAHLSKAGVVTSTQQGRQVIYAPAFERIESLTSYLMENCCSGGYCPPANAVKGKASASCR
jgi:ArsR family transcriptional regulator, arsenate/arsenite/antimonite-responsive transcriptional repressor